MIKRTLEQRIARLEKLLNSKVKKSHKFESKDDIAFEDPDYLDYDDDFIYYDEDDEDWDDDDDFDEDDMDECSGRNCESRKYAIRTRKVESNRPLKRTKNEAVKQLPNGMTANNVADVLSGFAGTSWSNPRAAIAKLDRMGILDASTNKWYPTVDDVAAAIEDCWDDSIGNGRGAAEFFIGNFGGATRCSLTLYPISGGTSRARNLTIKFNWPEEDIM